MNHPLNNFIFFGGTNFGLITLLELEKFGFLPKIIVTTPTKKSGRGMKEVESEIKLWAENKKIQVLQPILLNNDFAETLTKPNCDVYIVSAYGKIIPNTVLNIPKLGSFNIHPSLLPKYRGPSPIQSQIISDEKNIGVTVIKMDDKVDHGPILGIVKEENFLNNLSYNNFGSLLFQKGVKILVEKLPKLIENEISLSEQDDTVATFTKKYSKEDALIDINSDKVAYLKFLAFSENLGVFFDYHKNNQTIRIKINEAVFEDNKFLPKTITLPGKKPIKYSDFLRNEKIM
jgi:methionyl-tRNA formyltransferase